MDASCIVYLTSNLDSNEVKKMIIHELINKSFYESDFSVFVNKNVDYNQNKQSVFPDGFLYFKFVVVIDFSITDLTKVVSLINTILIFCWNNNLPAIATCDYEDLLINNGGYLSKEVPFPKD